MIRKLWKWIKPFVYIGFAPDTSKRPKPWEDPSIQTYKTYIYGNHVSAGKWME